MQNRTIEISIKKSFFKNQVIVLYGPRRVGKTTLVKKIIAESELPSVYYQADDPQVRDSFTNKSVPELFNLIKNYKIVVIDEAQNILNIGTTLKLIVDNYPEIQIIATGSSSFELSNRINEPLTGRKKVFFLYPFSLDEVTRTSNPIEKKSILKDILRFGLYPQVYTSSTPEKKEMLDEIASSYLYKDILSFEKLKYPTALESLLRALAYQLGSEVSFSNLGNLLNLDQFTVQKYLELLEKAFVIFRLNNYSTNKRKEVKQSRKYYFYDLGIRNWLVKNYDDLELRTDIGGIWENFCILERAKYLDYSRGSTNKYFWRNYNNQEIDYIEEYSGKLNGYEFKWGLNKKSKMPENFLTNYPGSSLMKVDPDSFWQFYNKVI